MNECKHDNTIETFNGLLCSNCGMTRCEILDEKLSEARADALRMAEIAIYLESCAESRFDTGDHSSEKREAQRIIAKYEEK